MKKLESKKIICFDNFVFNEILGAEYSRDLPDNPPDTFRTTSRYYPDKHLIQVRLTAGWSNLQDFKHSCSSQIGSECGKKITNHHSIGNIATYHYLLVVSDLLRSSVLYFYSAHVYTSRLIG